MFDILIALFGGIYFLGKYTYEKITDTNATINTQQLLNRRENLKILYGASYDFQSKTKEYIYSGEHFEDICNSLATDLKYVFGSEWKSILNIPNGYRVNYSILYPSMHEYWIYHLLLAKQGKIDSMIFFDGYNIGCDKEAIPTNVKFAECIEKSLINANVKNIKFGLELENWGTRHRLPTELYGGNLKIQSVAIYPTHRLWADYVKKA